MRMRMGLGLGMVTMLVSVPWTPAEGHAQSATAADSAAIRATALDYADGWFDGDGERMHRALHWDLAKRMVWTDPEGRSHLDHMGAMALVDGANMRRVPVPEDERKVEVRILDVFGDAGIVRVDSAEFVDYLNVIRWNGEWKIINVLWELRPSRKGAFSGR